MNRKAIVILEDGVQASPNNGISIVTLEKGEIYDSLPEFVMQALVESKRARWATPKDIQKALEAAEAADGAKPRRGRRKKKADDAANDGDAAASGAGEANDAGGDGAAGGDDGGQK